jgi:hypothetical protein
MRAVEKQSTNDSAPARAVLLQSLPLGTGRETAITALRGEGLGCQAIAKPITDTRLHQRFVEARRLPNISNDVPAGKNWVDCQARTPNVMGYGQWIVGLEFDADGKLSDAGVAILNIFL